MAVGDIKAKVVEIPANSYADILAGSGEHWIIHNVYHEHDIRLCVVDKSTSPEKEVCFDEARGSGVYAKFVFHVSDKFGLRIYNLDTENARKIAYDGVQVK